jgi:hypothetical protein
MDAANDETEAQKPTKQRTGQAEKNRENEPPPA